VPTFGGSAISAIAVHPTNSQILLTSVWSGNFGLYRSKDAGATWTPVLAGSASYTMFDPTNGNVAYAAIGNPSGGATNGVYKSADAGLTWTKLTGTGVNLFPTTNVGWMPMGIAPYGSKQSATALLRHQPRLSNQQTVRHRGSRFRPDLTGGGSTLTTIAVAPSDSNTVWAGSLDGRVQVTTNAGSGSSATWTNRSAGLPNRTVTQIAVDPINKLTAYVAFSGFIPASSREITTAIF